MTARLGPPDWAAVERICGGDPTIHARPIERGDAVRQLTALGLSTRQIAVRLQVSERTVTRWRVRRTS